MLPVRCLLGRRCLTSPWLVVRRWLISESSCCPALAWTLRVLWSSPAVSVLGLSPVSAGAERCGLPSVLFSQRSKQRGIFRGSKRSAGSLPLRASPVSAGRVPCLLPRGSGSSSWSSWVTEAKVSLAARR